MPDRSILLVDLNNFARYPTVSIGYLASILREAGRTVRVLSPFSVGVRGVDRERRPGAASLALQKLNYRLSTSPSRSVRILRETLAAARRSQLSVRSDWVVRGFVKSLRVHRPGLVMISTYLMYRDLCARLCAAAEQESIPVVVGGPYFAQRELVAEWVRTDGLTALVTAEIEPHVVELVDTVLAGGDPSSHPGVFVGIGAGEPRGTFAPPLEDLESLPIPDYSDFPWSLYPNRIVPIITGRGCAWNACTFCSDITSTAGRSFRSRTSSSVLSEIAKHHTQLSVDHFVFTDLKLNGDLDVWNGILQGMQAAAPHSRWIASVHVGPDAARGNGLSGRELGAAAASGCVRLTTGLETGSQRIADLMRKGTALERTAEFLRSATDAGISCRCTMILGYPGERAEDVDASVTFLRRHGDHIGRVSLNRLAITTGSALHRMLEGNPRHFTGMHQVSYDHGLARIDHYYSESSKPEYRRSVMALLEAVHWINSRDLPPRARAFEGVM